MFITEGRGWVSKYFIKGELFFEGVVAFSGSGSRISVF